MKKNSFIIFYMEFIENSSFTKWICENITDNSYNQLQIFLFENPEAGKVIKGCNGLRKIRWKLANQGKRGSIRIIYYYKPATSQIFFIFAYSKKEQGDLTSQQRKVLSALCKEL